MNYLKNPGNVYYPIKKYNKNTDKMRLEDPHTGETFMIHNVRETIRLANYKVVKSNV